MHESSARGRAHTRARTTVFRARAAAILMVVSLAALLVFGGLARASAKPQRTRPVTAGHRHKTRARNGSPSRHGGKPRHHGSDAGQGKGSASGLGPISGFLPRDHLTEKSAIDVNLSNETVRLPIYRGTAPVPNGAAGQTETVWYVLLDASDAGLANDLDVNYAPKLQNIGISCPACVQTVTLDSPSP